MIIALLALALAMIVGGMLAVFFGWDIVLIERGWTMVIAGSITAASGAVLLGVTAVVSKLARIEARLSGLREGLGEGRSAGASPSGQDLSAPALAGGLLAEQAPGETDVERFDDAQPSLPLFDKDERRERDEPAVTTAEWPEDRGTDASIVPFPPRTKPVVPQPPEESEPELKVPDFLLAERRREVEETSPGAEQGVKIFDPGPESREPEPQELDERDGRPESGVEAADERESELEAEAAPELKSEAEPAASQEAEQVEKVEQSEPEKEPAPDESLPVTVVGTYDSGDNRYVMYSDGSIEAHTPGGVFRFKSLDELKEFIAAGGEGNSSTAT